MDVARYSIRQLSPFRGVVQLIESEQAQAVSSDGESWQINVRIAVPEQGWGTLGRGTRQRVMLYGFWSKRHGLKKLPLNPLLDPVLVEGITGDVKAALQDHAAEVPFPLIDRYELWLLDSATRLPLALLASSIQSDGLTFPRRLAWQATAQSDLDFNAPSLAEEIDATAPHSAHQHREALERVIKQAAGTTPYAQWFLRDTDGGGQGRAVNIPHSQLEGRRLAADAFPELLLRENWDMPRDQALVQDYLHWQAPRLLTLALSDVTRARLEHAARDQAMLVMACHRLYPHIINSDVINAALVEAVMRQANP